MELENDKTIEQLIAGLSETEKRWADHYINCLNKTEATKRTGLSHARAMYTGIEFYKRPAVRAYIDFVIRAFIGEPDESLRRLRAIADTDLKDYLTGVKVARTEMIEVPLTQLLREARDKLADEEDYYLCECEGAIENTRSLKRQKVIKLEIFELKKEIARHPRAKRVVAGPTKLVTEMQLDLVKLSRDHERGRIKTFRIAKDGSIAIEMYDAKDADIQLLKIHGSFEVDNKQKNPPPTTDFTPQVINGPPLEYSEQGAENV